MTWRESGGPGVKTPENQMRKRTGEKKSDRDVKGSCSLFFSFSFFSFSSSTESYTTKTLNALLSQQTKKHTLHNYTKSNPN